MCDHVKSILSAKSVLKQKHAGITESEKAKVKSLSARIETSSNQKFVVRCFLVAAFFMCVLQSGQIVKFVDGFSPNLLSDSAKVASREWHKGMENAGLAGIKDRMTAKVHDFLPELKAVNQAHSVIVENNDGSLISLRGAAEFQSEIQEIALVHKEPRSQTVFGQYKFRGSF